MSARDVVQECFEFDAIDFASFVKDYADCETSQRLFDRRQVTSFAVEVQGLMEAESVNQIRSIGLEAKSRSGPPPKLFFARCFH